MELRHLRYFVAVAEEGSLTNAAERRLHTDQPSLSWQIRDLELEVGLELLERKARGMTLTAAGRVLLNHAQLALMQIEVACEAARDTERPEKPGLSSVDDYAAKTGIALGLEKGPHRIGRRKRRTLPQSLC
jgi:LysR family transcriptional regulator, hca operon transcriptional activator